MSVRHEVGVQVAPSRECGFTLLEMLAVIMLMGLLLTLAGGALVAGHRALAAAERHGDQLEAARATRRFLRESIAGAMPLNVARSGERGTVFLGESARMAFYAPLSSGIGGGIYRVRLTLAQDRLTATLARLEGASLKAWGDPQTLIEPIATARFRYRGRSPLGQSSGWLESWPWPERLPDAVRIELESARGAPAIREQISMRLDLGGD